MFLYLVRPESSRIFCCKVYKWIGVVFRWLFFFPGVFSESVVFTEVRRRSRSVGGGCVNRNVTERLRGYLARGRVYTGVTEVKYIYKPCWACCEVLCGITAFKWKKIFLLCFDIPVFWLDNKLPTTLKLRTRNSLPHIGVRIGNDDAWTTEINEENYFLETGEQRKMA